MDLFETGYFPWIFVHRNLQDTVSIGHKWIFLKWVISLEKIFLSKLAGHFNNWSSMDVFEMGYRWFQLFFNDFYIPAPRRGRGVYCFTSVLLSVLPSVQDIFRHIFLSNYWWQKSDIWSQASYRYPISWEAFLDPSDSYFLFAEERGYHKWALAHSSSC